MTRDPVWACPKCGTDMAPGSSALLRNWHCPACNFEWVWGETLAAFLPTVKAFAKLRAAAESGEIPTRMLQCPVCRTRPMRLVRVGGVVIDVCKKCVGVALDPGEIRALTAYGQRRNLVLDAADALTGIDAILRLPHML